MAAPGATCDNLMGGAQSGVVALASDTGSSSWWSVGSCAHSAFRLRAADVNTIALHQLLIAARPLAEGGSRNHPRCRLGHVKNASPRRRGGAAMPFIMQTFQSSRRPPPGQTRPGGIPVQGSTSGPRHAAHGTRFAPTRSSALAARQRNCPIPSPSAPGRAPGRARLALGPTLAMFFSAARRPCRARAVDSMARGSADIDAAAGIEAGTVVTQRRVARGGLRAHVRRRRRARGEARNLRRVPGACPPGAKGRGPRRLKRSRRDRQDRSGRSLVWRSGRGAAPRLVTAGPPPFPACGGGGLAP